MTTKPSVIPTWATDPLLTGGPQSGQTPRLDPGAGIRAQGIYQGHKVPGRGLGWMLGMIGDWLGYFDDLTQQSALRSWTHANVGGTTNPIGQHLLALYPQGLQGAPIVNPALIGVVGTKVSNSHAWLAVSPDGVDFSDPLNVAAQGFDLGYTHYSAVATDPFGVAFGGLSGVTTCKAFTPGATVTTFTVTAMSGPVEACAYGATHYVVASAPYVFRCTTLTGTWTTFLWSNAGDTVQQIVANGDLPNGIAPTRLILTKFNATNNHFEAWYSTDDAATWTLGHDFGATAVLSAAWSPGLGLFVVVDSNTMKLWVSPDGAAWTFKTLSGSGFVGGVQQLAACGSCIAHVVNRTTTDGVSAQGLAYTFDAGATWREVFFGKPLTSQPIRCVMSANGRLYAADDFNVYVSGEVATGPFAYTGS